MGLLKEFKEFALRGNVMDMAVGVIIGTAFGKIAASLVNDVVMPPLSLLVGKVDFTSLVYPLGEGEQAPVMKYGSFLQTTLDFLILAAAVFVMIKLMNTAMRSMQKKEAVAAPPPPATKDCPRCCSAIAIKATRCPHCTSEIGA